LVSRPEWYDDQYGPESANFSFELILYERLGHMAALPRSRKRIAIAPLSVVDDQQRVIRAFDFPKVQRLIRSCRKRDPWRQRTFIQMLIRFQVRKFTLTPNVNSSKRPPFVKNLHDWNETNDSSIMRADETPSESIIQSNVFEPKVQPDYITTNQHTRPSAA
jgi:hypothetical protein